jgi:hypothetical protein
LQQPEAFLLHLSSQAYDAGAVLSPVWFPRLEQLLLYFVGDLMLGSRVIPAHLSGSAAFAADDSDADAVVTVELPPSAANSQGLLQVRAASGYTQCYYSISTAAASTLMS